MRVATIEDGRGGLIYIRPGSMFYDTSRPYLRVLRVDTIEIEHEPVYLARCSVYVQFPETGMISRPKPVLVLIEDLTTHPFQTVPLDGKTARWVDDLRLTGAGVR